jgi:hypothetical protein
MMPELTAAEEEAVAERLDRIDERRERLAENLERIADYFGSRQPKPRPNLRVVECGDDA